MNASLLLLLLWLYEVRSQDTNICNAEQNEPMYCTCDVSDLNLAHRASCSVIRKITKGDFLWRKFKTQENIEELTISSRKETQEMDFVPMSTLRSLKHLKMFIMRDSYLRKIPPNTFVNMTKLEVISLRRNNIHVLETNAFANLEALKELSLDENRISEMAAEVLNRLPSLMSLHLEDNNLTTIADLAFFELSNLEELGLSRNHLHHLTPKTFVGLRSLKRLGLSRNWLTTLGDGYFSGATALEELDLWSNNIHHVTHHAFDGLNYLQVLTLSHNKIKSLSDHVFKGTPRLKMVSLNNNLLHKFQKELLAPLHFEGKQGFVVHLQDNPLKCSCDLNYLLQLSELTNNSMMLRQMHLAKCLMQSESKTNDEKSRRLSDLSAQELNCPVITTIPTTTTTTTTIMALSTTAPPSDDPDGKNYSDDSDISNEIQRSPNNLYKASSSKNSAAKQPLLHLLSLLCTYTTLSRYFFESFPA